MEIKQKGGSPETPSGPPSDPIPFSEAFSPGRAIKHGIEAVKRAPFPLLCGAFILGFTEGGGSGNSFSSTGDVLDDGGNDWDYGGYDYDFGSDWNYKLLSDGLGDLVQTGQIAGSAPTDAFLQGLMGSSDFDDPAMIGAILGAMCCFSVLILIFFALRCWVKVGWIRLHEQVITTGEGTFGVLFGGSDRVVDMAIWAILATAINVGAIFASVIPGALVMGVGAAMEMEPLIILGGLLLMILMIPALVYIGLGLAMGDHALVLEGKSPMQALERSWELADGNRVTLFIFNFVMALFAFAAVFLGLLMCCIGVILTSPASRAAIDVGFTESFLMHTRGKSEALKWKLVEVAGGLY
ncbi:MAG: hypothetical protein GY913_10360 [Proteobacteria bacterium]|nr:hypothetical protein [Pseudomonadota bacterium]MCP4917315.1 hypothetical protein [Pseudomonadota bacterium]